MFSWIDLLYYQLLPHKTTIKIIFVKHNLCGRWPKINGLTFLMGITYTCIAQWQALIG